MIVRSFGQTADVTHYTHVILLHKLNWQHNGNATKDVHNWVLAWQKGPMKICRSDCCWIWLKRWRYHVSDLRHVRMQPVLWQPGLQCDYSISRCSFWIIGTIKTHSPTGSSSILINYLQGLYAKCCISCLSSILQYSAHLVHIFPLWL